MSEFFKPFRRKIGILTLLTACILMGLWIRTTVVSDVIGWSFQDEYRLELTSGELHWSRIRWPNGSYLALWPAEQAPPFWQRVWWTAHYKPFADVPHCRFLTRYDFLGAEISVSEQRHGLSVNAMKDVMVTLWRIPILLLVVPLTSLSLYPLLSNPRVSKPTSESS